MGCRCKTIRVLTDSRKMTAWMTDYSFALIAFTYQNGFDFFMFWQPEALLPFRLPSSIASTTGGWSPIRCFINESGRSIMGWTVGTNRPNSRQLSYTYTYTFMQKYIYSKFVKHHFTVNFAIPGAQMCGSWEWLAERWNIKYPGRWRHMPLTCGSKKLIRTFH